MAEAKLLHHVFSSDRGYRTLFSSPGLRDRLPVVENFARAARAKNRSMRVSAWLGDGSAAAAKVFPAGADHVGRPRMCVHTIVIDAGEISDKPFFCPSSVPDDGPFLGENLNYGNMPKTWNCNDSLSIPDLLAGAKSSEIFVPLLTAVLSAHHQTALISSGEDTDDLLTALLLFLPAPFRKSFSIVRGAFLGDVEGFAPFRLFVLAEREEAAKLASGGHVVIDERTGKVTNLPAAGPYVELMTRILSFARGSIILPNLFWLLEKNKHDGKPTADALRHLSEALLACVPCVDEQGEADVARAPERILTSVMPFFSAGYAELAARLLVQCFDSARSASSSGIMGAEIGQLARLLGGRMRTSGSEAGRTRFILQKTIDALAQYFARKRVRSAAKRSAGIQRVPQKSAEPEAPTESSLSWDF